MSKLVPPHGSSELKPLLLEGEAREQELERAKGLKKVPMTSRETSDLIMMGIGAFTPLDGFMGKEDWKGCCDSYSMPSKKGLFWPIPDHAVGRAKTLADSIAIGEEVALWDTETEAIMGTMKVAEKYTIDKEHECKQVFRTNDPAHPGVQKVMEQGPVNLAGPVKVLSESLLPGDVQGHLPASGRSAQAVRGARLEHGGGPAAAQPDARLPRLPGLDRHRGLRRRLRPPARRQAEARRHPGRSAREGHRRAGQQVFPQGARDPGRIPDGDALRRAARGAAARRLPPELRLLAPDRRAATTPAWATTTARSTRRRSSTRSRPTRCASGRWPWTGPSTATSAAAWRP